MLKPLDFRKHSRQSGLLAGKCLYTLRKFRPLWLFPCLPFSSTLKGTLSEAVTVLVLCCVHKQQYG